MYISVKAETKPDGDMKQLISSTVLYNLNVMHYKKTTNNLHVITFIDIYHILLLYNFKKKLSVFIQDKFLYYYCISTAAYIKTL